MHDSVSKNKKNSTIALSHNFIPECLSGENESTNLKIWMHTYVHYNIIYNNWASLVAQMAKNLPVMQKTWVQSQSRGPLEKKMATNSSILAWRIPWMEEPGGLQSMGSQRVRHS